MRKQEQAVIESVEQYAAMARALLDRLRLAPTAEVEECHKSLKLKNLLYVFRKMARQLNRLTLRWRVDQILYDIGRAKAKGIPKNALPWLNRIDKHFAELVSTMQEILSESRSDGSAGGNRRLGSAAERKEFYAGIQKIMNRWHLRNPRFTHKGMADRISGSAEGTGFAISAKTIMNNTRNPKSALKN